MRLFNLFYSSIELMSIYFIFFLFAKQISSQCIDILRVDDSNGFDKTISQLGKHPLQK